MFYFKLSHGLVRLISVNSGIVFVRLPNAGPLAALFESALIWAAS